MRRPLLVAALAGTFLATPALADVTVRYKAVIPATAPANIRENPPSMTISADGAGQARWEMAAPGVMPGGGEGGRTPSVALIAREGVGYFVLNGPGPNMQIIGRIDDALSLATGLATPLLQGSARDAIQQALRHRVEITPVGPETVSGVQGNLYRIVIVTGETRSQPIEWVVATDPRLAPVGAEFARMTESLRPTVVTVLGGEPQLYAAIRGMAGLGAPLRIGNEMRLDTVSVDDVPDSQFALPGPVMTREQLQMIMGMMMGMMGQGGMRPPGAPPAPPATPAPSTPH